MQSSENLIGADNQQERLIKIWLGFLKKSRNKKHLKRALLHFIPFENFSRDNK